MEQNLENYNFVQKNFGERVVNVQRRKKCNLCDYASSHTGHLKAHLKTHSGENFFWFLFLFWPISKQIADVQKNL